MVSLTRVPSPVPAAKDDVTVRLLTAFKRLIFEGSLMPGSRLPAERDLAETFHVSRSSLRQALKALEIMGVISQRVGDGTYVNTSALALLWEPMEFLILLNGISFDELMEARVIVEPELAARAASSATDADLSTLRREMAAMKNSDGDNRLLSEHDLKFHRAIFQAAGNRVCSMMFTVIHESLRNLMELTSRMVPVEHTLHLHQRIYTAIRRKDPEEARRRMSEHLLDAKALLVKANDQQRTTRLQHRITQLAPQPEATPAKSRKKK